MSRATVRITTQADRQKIARWAAGVPDGTTVEFRSPRRSLEQNSLLWSLLGELARQMTWYGQKLSPDDWKDVFTASLRKARVVPGIDPGSFVVLGLHTSDMTKDEMSNLIELILAFGAEHGVVFRDPPLSSIKGGVDGKPPYTGRNFRASTAGTSAPNSRPAYFGNGRRGSWT